MASAMNIRSHCHHRAPTLAIKMQKAWPVFASALNRQLAITCSGG